MAKAPPDSEDRRVHLPGYIDPNDRAALKLAGFELRTSSPSRTVAYTPPDWTQSCRRKRTILVLCDEQDRERIFVYLNMTMEGTAPDGRYLTRTRTELHIEPCFKVQKRIDGSWCIYDHARDLNLRDSNGNLLLFDSEGQALGWLHLNRPDWDVFRTYYWNETCPATD